MSIAYRSTLPMPAPGAAVAGFPTQQRRRRLLVPLRRMLCLLASLRLTVVTLTLSMMLVFAGTLAQVDHGIWIVQKDFFEAWFVWRSLAGTSLPVMPGGYLLGAVLLVNLLAAHATRWRFAWKRSGILLVHSGLVIIIVGQLLTGLLAVESTMTIDEGGTSNFTESQFTSELALVEGADAAVDRVYSVPQGRLKSGATIAHQAWPITLTVDRFMGNSRVVARGAPPLADRGLGRQFGVTEIARATAPNERDVPSAYITVRNAATGEKLGTWLLSSAFTVAQELKIGDRSLSLQLRPKRYHLPFSIELLDFQHEKHLGTDIPSNFASVIRLRDLRQNEDRQTRIYMNNPLRYRGLTFYQASFANNDRTSILQVVRNPAWLLPYISCVMIGGGMLVQFTLHLVRFGKRRSA